MANTRFHDAARDGYLDLLSDATRRDCNMPDEDGMTPIMWAAACGNLDALRMLIGRGGDPNKSDFYGNTALHCAAANNQLNCVSYLVNFGVNLFALQNEYHTAKELAGIKGHEEVLRYLDACISKQSALNAKTVQKQKERAIADAEKRIREMEKLQKKATKKAEKDEKRMAKERTKMAVVVTSDDRGSVHVSTGPQDMGTIGFASQRKDTKFSDIVNNSSGRGTCTGNGTFSAAAKKGLSGVSKKILQTKRNNANNSVDSGLTGGGDGRHSVRSLSGIQRDSEVVYLPKYVDAHGTTSSSGEHRKRLQDVFDPTGGRIHRVASEPFLNEVGTNSIHNQQQPSLFERPGFGNVAFRQSMEGTLRSINHDFNGRLRILPMDDNSFRLSKSVSSGRRSHTGSDSDSIGSAGSLAHGNIRTSVGGGVGYVSIRDWINEEGTGEDDSDDTGSADDDGGDDQGADASLVTFLMAYDLRPCLAQLKHEQIDLRALLMLDESDLKELGFSLGTRKKLMDAIVRRREALRSAGEVCDSRL